MTTALDVWRATERFDPRQPRDEDGKWVDGPGAAGAAVSKAVKAGRPPARRARPAAEPTSPGDHAASLRGMSSPDAARSYLAGVKGADLEALRRQEGVPRGRADQVRAALAQKYAGSGSMATPVGGSKRKKKGPTEAQVAALDALVQTAADTPDPYRSRTMEPDEVTLGRIRDQYASGEMSQADAETALNRLALRFGYQSSKIAISNALTDALAALSGGERRPRQPEVPVEWTMSADPPTVAAPNLEAPAERPSARDLAADLDDADLDSLIAELTAIRGERGGGAARPASAPKTPARPKKVGDSGLAQQQRDEIAGMSSQADAEAYVAKVKGAQLEALRQAAGVGRRGTAAEIRRAIAYHLVGHRVRGDAILGR